MKRLIVFVLTLVLTVLLSACGKETLHIEDYQWKMRVVMSDFAEVPADEDALVIAVGEFDELYPNAKIVELILTASDGTIMLVDATNDETYSGTYSLLEETSKEIHYEIAVGGIIGRATLSSSKRYSGMEKPTLPIHFGEYSVYFLPNEMNETK